jgi:phosphatidylserine/phosphatidylglycerophosphate/cardiolipin synthase-like enzyme
MPGPNDLDFGLRFSARILSGRHLYDEVVRDGILSAKRAVWIATANLKEMYVQGARGRYRSIMESFQALHDRGVDLRILHAEVPSRRFRASFDRKKELVRGGLKLKHCPRNHMKAVIIDGERLYLGSANLTGAGLGAKGDDRRNFELGLVTEEPRLLDEVQALFDALWRGRPCDACKVRELCPDPGAYATGRLAKKPLATKRAVKRLDDDESG